MGIFTKIFKTKNERTLKKLENVLLTIKNKEKQYQNLTVEQLHLFSTKFKEDLKQTSLDDILPDVYAFFKQVVFLISGKSIYDEQLLGAIGIHYGNIVEMKTGEGKTLTSLFPAYLNALTGKGVHLLTANEYLAQRDFESASLFFNPLGISVGIINKEMKTSARKENYLKDITYATAQEIAFDYLRNSQILEAEHNYFYGFNYAIIDEVDSILLDAARTPCIITSESVQNEDQFIYPLLYKKIKTFEKDIDYTFNHKTKELLYTENGYIKLEEFLIKTNLIQDKESLYNGTNNVLIQCINACLKALVTCEKDQDYTILENKVVLIDQNTGRLLPNQTWNDGVHQAVQAKEELEITPQTIESRSIVYTSLFNMYEKLSGMTGTADTDAFEFKTIYQLDTIVIPTHKPIKRIDYPDRLFLTIKDKYTALIKDVIEKNNIQRPVLIATASVEMSEEVSRLLTENNIKYTLLNAKNHFQEAQIIAKAGLLGQVTVATNMAGRGTDIILGGNLDYYLNLGFDIDKAIEMQKLNHEKVNELGGLHVIGVTRQDSRRIDNQLIGRAGRQGDNGSSNYYLSLEDRFLMPYYKQFKFIKYVIKNNEDGIQTNLLSNKIREIQLKMEHKHFEIRKNLNKYNEIINQIQFNFFKYRTHVLHLDTKEKVDEMYINILSNYYKNNLDVENAENEINGAKTLYHQLSQDPNYLFDENNFIANRILLLKIYDHEWELFLYNVNQIKEGIHLSGYAQKEPQREYSNTCQSLFKDMMLVNISQGVFKILNTLR